MILFSKPSPILHHSSTMNGFIYLFLLVILLGSALSSCSQTTFGDIQSTPATQIQGSCSIQNSNTNSAISVSVDHSSPAGISQFSPGLSLIDNSLDYPWNHNDPSAISNVKSLIEQGIPFVNNPIMAWGVDDPWPNPSQAKPSNWSSLDTNLQLILQTGGIPVITLSEAPWWMKGQLEPDGSTRLLKQSDEWSNIAYSSRILDNNMGAWLQLVQSVAERYMVPPYNVRYFQVWNELKGYYNPITNAYDYTTSPGDPGGPNAKHGYTYMYNLVYSRLMQVATSLGIPTDTIKVGGPYVVMDTWGSKYQSTLSNISRVYGTYDQRSLDVVLYWLEHKAGAGFIALDASNSNRDNINPANPFVASEKFTDMVVWLRSLDNTRYPGAKTLPVWMAEWYAMPYGNTPNNQYNDAIKSYAMIKFLKAGGSVALLWGGLNNGASDSGLWTPTTAGGGQPLPWYFSYKAFKDYFAPGTAIYNTVVSAPESIETLASASHIMLVNKTTKSLTASVNGSFFALSPYQVCVGSF